jgi:integrase
MPQKKTGTIVMKPSGAFARAWVTLPDGTEERRWMNLQTKDRTTAKRKLARLVAMIAAGELVADAEAKTASAETYRSFTLDRHERREAAGVSMARDELRVTDDHVRQLLEAAQEAGLGYETIDKIRAVVLRDLKRAKIEKLIAANPAEDVELPAGLKKDKRPFVSPTDAEIAKMLAAPKGDLELKLLVLVARTEGGMRTAELLRWDWSMIDLAGFAFCKIKRAKTDEVQTLEMPEVLRPFVRVWWEWAGSPVAGPVFPVRRGPRAGKDKKGRGTSFAGRIAPRLLARRGDAPATSHRR